VHEKRNKENEKNCVLSAFQPNTFKPVLIVSPSAQHNAQHNTTTKKNLRNHAKSSNMYPAMLTREG
jgi:hypothetical protein